MKYTVNLSEEEYKSLIVWLREHDSYRLVKKLYQILKFQHEVFADDGDHDEKR